MKEPNLEKNIQEESKEIQEKFNKEKEKIAMDPLFEQDTSRHTYNAPLESAGEAMQQQKREEEMREKLVPIGGSINNEKKSDEE